MNRLLSTLLSLIVLTFGIFAQETERPQIGLVLSGGGAKGLAHVGILQALDSAGLNIDYITGTSMGAIIAAMYASGYTGNEIERVAREMDWMDAIMSPNIKFKDLTIDEQDETNNYIIEVPIDKGLKFKISTGIFEPAEVMYILQKTFFPMYKYKDFSKLPIPFKCVATDLRDGSAVVFDKGDLAFATRSSMAIPGVFAATEYKGTKLVDGGIVRNFPVQDVRDMGADYVIGVNLFSGLTDPSELSDMMSIMNQIINFRDAHDLVVEKSICDMIIEPDVTGFSAGSFGSADSIFAIGKNIGNEFYPLFKQIADSLKARYGDDYKYEHKMPEHYNKVCVRDFDVKGLVHTSKATLISSLGLSKGGRYSVDELNDAIRHAYTSRYYDNIRYELQAVDDKDGVCMKIIVDELPMSFLNIALGYDSFTNASLILGITRKNLMGKRSRSDVKLAISQNVQLHASHRLNYSESYSKFVEGNFSFKNFDIPVYSSTSSRKESQYDYNHTRFGITAGKRTDQDADLRAAMGYEFFHLTPDVSSDTVPYKGTIHNFSINLERRISTFERKYLPQQGFSIDVNAYMVLKPHYNLRNMPWLKSENVYRLTFEGLFLQRLRDNLTLFEGIDVAASYGDKVFVHNTFLGGSHKFLPSHFTFTGMATASRQESTLSVVKLGAQYRLIAELYAILQANAAVSFRSIDYYFDTLRSFYPTSHIIGFSGTLAYNLSRMPFELSMLYTPDYKFGLNVHVGFYF